MINSVEPVCTVILKLIKDIEEKIILNKKCFTYPVKSLTVIKYVIKTNDVQKTYKWKKYKLS